MESLHELIKNIFYDYHLVYLHHLYHSILNMTPNWKIIVTLFPDHTQIVIVQTLQIIQNPFCTSKKCFLLLKKAMTKSNLIFFPLNGKELKGKKGKIQCSGRASAGNPLQIMFLYYQLKVLSYYKFRSSQMLQLQEYSKPS